MARSRTPPCSRPSPTSWCTCTSLTRSRWWWWAARPTATGASWAPASAAPPPWTSGGSSGACSLSLWERVGVRDSSQFDLVVIGGGLAGLTAGLFAARYGLSVVVLESVVPGGHLINVEKIEDFPGL